MTDTARRPGRVGAAFGLLAAAALAAGAWVWVRGGGAPREELAAVPGAAVSREGVTTQKALFTEALALLGRRNFVGAESVYREVLAREPLNAPAYVGIGTARFQQNDLDGARQHYARALEIDASSTAAMLGLGSVAYSQRRYKVAEQYYGRVLAAKGPAADAHWGLGLTYDAMGRGAKAREHYAEYVRLAPDSGQAGIARSRLAVLATR